MTNMDNVKGNIKEGAGKLTGDEQLEAEGKGDQLVGKVKEAADDVIDAVKGVADAVKDRVTGHGH